MTQVLRMDLEDGSSLLVEATEPGGPELDRVGRASDVLNHTADTLEQALERVKPALSSMVRQAKNLVEPPQRLAVEFGIKVTAGAGIVVARAATEANFKLTLEWSKADSSSS